MSRFRPLALSLIAVGLLAASTTGATATVQSGQRPAAVPDAELQRVFVKLDHDVSAQFLDRLTELGVVRGLEIPTIDAVAVTAAPRVIARLADLPGVIAVQPQRRIQLDLYASVEQIKARGVNEPADYQVDGQTFTRPGVTGEGVTIGIIDSGIFAEHPGLAGKVLLGLNFELGELQDTGGIPPEEWDAYAESTGDNALVDEVGHGTHVAGTVAGTGAGAQGDQDLSGVAPGANVISLKIASGIQGVADDFWFEENAVLAIDYLTRHPELGVTLTNNSWGLLETEPGANGVEGEPTDFDAAAEVTRAAVDAGITMVFSAGNDGPDAGTIGEDPGGIEEVITVGNACKVDGSCPEGEMHESSSRGNADGTGPQVDVSAPGDEILAPAAPSVLIPLSRCADKYTEEPLYLCLSGTSMASPHVAGTVALMQEVNPALTPAQAEQCLIDTADDMLDPGFDIHSGYGMTDTAEALTCAHHLSVGGGGTSGTTTTTTGTTGTTATTGTTTTTTGTTDTTGTTGAPSPSPSPEVGATGGDSTPSTGGGLALTGLGLTAAAAAMRRRRAR